MTSDTKYTREDVHAAFSRAIRETENIVGEDMALEVITGALELADYLPAGTGEVTFLEAAAAYNAMANRAKEDYNPDETEDGDSIRADSTGDLVVNLASGFLRDDEAETDDVIAAAWRELDPDEFPSWEQWRKAYEGAPIDAAETYARERNAAIVAEVVSWF
jgi:hypothetical protein